MCRPDMVPIVLASLFLFSAVGRAQGPSPPKVDINAVHGLWVNIKRELTGPNGSEVFTNRLDHAALPPRSLWLGGSDMAPLTSTSAW